VTPEQKSALLTTAAPDRSAHQFGTPAAVRQRAGEVMTAVPFPAKRNSGAALNWEHQGPLTEAEVQRLVQVNAMCDWLRQAVEEFEAGALSPTARRVVSDIPRWSMLRGLPFSGELAAAATAMEAGDATPLMKVLRFCERPKKESRSAWEMETG
jgi:hypothetical protein